MIVLTLLKSIAVRQLLSSTVSTHHDESKRETGCAGWMHPLLGNYHPAHLETLMRLGCGLQAISTDVSQN